MGNKEQNEMRKSLRAITVRGDFGYEGAKI